MRYLVVSDSHNNTKNLEKIIWEKPYDGIIHAGDGVCDLEVADNMEKYGVRGNCDIYADFPDELIFSIAGRKVYLCHGHKYKVKNSYDSLVYRAMELNVDICIFGHTHRQVKFMHKNITFINPGSIGVKSQLSENEMFFYCELQLLENCENIIDFRSIPHHKKEV